MDAKERLTATAAIRIGRNKSRIPKMTGQEFKKLAKTIAEKYGIEPRDALCLLRGEKLLEIVAKYEKREKGRENGILR